MRSRSLAALLFALWFCGASPMALAQSSQPPSTDIEQPSSPTGPTEEFVSQTLRPLLEQALTSSQESDASSATLQQQIERDRLQRRADDAQRRLDERQRQSEAEQRLKEQQDSATAYKQLSSRAETLQTYFDALSSKLTDFSGSEEDRQAAALVAVDQIKADASALSLSLSVWKGLGIAAGILALIEGALIGAHAVGWIK